jgi:hypothetical protein
MKKSKFMPGWIFIIFFLILPGVVSGQISKNLSFSDTSIERKVLKKQGASYEQVTMKRASHSREIGKPDLPLFYYKFYVPKSQWIRDL